MLRTIGIVIASLAFSPLAQAADNGIYLGAGYSQSDYGLSRPADIDDFDDEDSGYKLIAGFRPLDNFGVELNYVDHGDVTVPLTPTGIACPGSCPILRAGAETISGFAVGFLAFPVVDLFAKVGASSWQFDGNAGPGVRVDESDVEFAWGAGVQAHFWSLAARLEYERIEVAGDGLGTVSLSFIYTFL